MAEFKFMFRLEYCPEVESSLYGLNFEVDAPDHAVQLKSPNRAVCLLCGSKLRMPLTQSSVAKHFDGTRHDAHDAFDYYHKVFMDLPDSEQSFQIYFNPLSADKVKCDICNARVAGDDVIKHVALEKLRNKTKIQADYFEFACENVTDNISLANLQAVAELEHPLIIQKIGSADVCLLCQKVLKMSVGQHLKTTAHQLHLNEATFSHLHRFHVFWQGQPESAQNYRKYFVPRGTKSATCILCGGSVKYSKLLEHATLESSCALLQPDDPLCEPEINWEERRVQFLNRNLNFPLNYEEDIRVIYYPTNLMNEVQKVDNVPLFTIQRQLENTRCLLCRKLFVGVVTTSAILTHLRTKEHQAMSYNTDCLLSLAFYHHFWSEQSPNLQVKQHTFIPHSVEQFKCDKCKLLIKPEEVVQHLNTCLINAIKKSETAKQQSDDEDYSYEEEASNLQESKEFTNATYEEETSKPEQRISSCLYDYDAATITKLYSSFNRCKNERRPTMYFMQKRSSRERYCLCCKRVLVGPALEHLKGKKHLKNFEDAAKTNVIHAYHMYWSSQLPEVQLDQVNYAPLTENTMTCLTCNTDLRFDQIKGHACLQLLKSCHENGGLPKQYHNLKSKCHESIVKKFYSKSFMTVQIKLFYSDMPLGLHWLGKISCLLCGKKILRDLSVWHQHLVMQHARASIDPGLLEAVRLYHQFWAEQSLEHQIMQVNFVPNTISTMKCSKRHLVNFADVTEHTCDKKNMDKLVKAVKKLTIGQDLARSADDSNVAGETASTSRTSAPLNIPPAVNGSNVSSPARKQSPGKKRVAPVKNGTGNNGNHGGEVSDNPSAGTHEIIPSEPPRERPDEVLLPYRLRHHVKYMARFGDKTRCTACDEILFTRREDILHHVSHPDHLRSANLMLPAYGYFCEICGFKVVGGEPKWNEHMESTAHAAVFSKLGTIRRSNMEEYECLSCNLVIYGDKLSLIRHQELYKVKREKKNSVSIDQKVMQQVHWLFHSPKATDKILNELLTESNEALENSDAMQECLEALELALSEKYPNCKAHPFGSRVTGIGNESSDLDVFMDIGDMYMGKENQESKQQQAIVVAVKNILMEDKTNFTDILPIPSARTPIVRVVHVATKIDCDLSFRNGLSVENTQYIKFCLLLQPKTRCALLLLKRWADIVSLKDEITSYALCMMLIFHLQLEEYLLSVDELRGLTTRDVRDIDDWEIVDYNKTVEELKVHVKEYKGDVYSLLRGFFKTYSEFDFDNELVCPLLGRTIFVNQFGDNGISLPEAMRAYKERILEDPDCQFKYKTSMCVQDPFDLGHNLTKAVPKPFRNKFRTLCSLTHKHMNNH